MDKNTESTDVLVNDIPLPVLDALGRQAERRGWSRVKMIRHILAQATAKEMSKAPKTISQNVAQTVE